MKAAGFILTCLSFLSSSGWAQFNSFRDSDARTKTPEAVMADRKAWGADFGFGGSFNRGNTDVDYLGSNLSLFRAWSPCTAYLDGSMIYSTFNGDRTVNQGNATARLDHRVRGPWEIFAFNTDAYDEFIQLDSRVTSGAGPWYDLALGPTKHGLSLAMVYDYEHFKYGIYHRDGRVSFRDISYFPLSRAAEVRTDFFYIPRVDNTGDYRLYGEIALQSLIWKQYLGLKLSWSDEYESYHQPGVKPNDSIWLTSLTLRLGK